ncbi:MULTISPECIES: sensor histidine kinase [Kitasatospora]|uniref:histidine kinase n=1 Tax=Kitasatospora cathayae TaxID=3004092 RepID=A0ABY7Q2S7_9ACTN|nr:histidine kinase [Kitasatospora sp. HUAS 3-15]WBP86960.1 histidine kinase [Kitasatospora sp. HUAS 3-15]
MLVPSLSPRRLDRLIALCGLLGGAVLTVFRVYERADQVPRWAVALPLLVMAGLELVRRTRPVLAVSLGGLAFAGSVVAGSLLATTIMYTDLLYAAALYGTHRMSRVLHLTGGATVLVLSSLVWYAAGTSSGLLVVVLSSLVFLAPVWTGELVRKHRLVAEAERLRAEQTALLSEMDRREAVGAERARMARELHDVVANHLSAIAIHATGAQSVARRRRLAVDDPLVEVLAVIRENSVQGLAEMRRMIGLLRDSGGGEGDESYAAPDLAAVDALLTKARAAGQGVGLQFELTELGERGAVPVPVGLAAYRIVQESLTNALKHAGPGLVAVRLEFGPEELRIAVDSPYRGEPGRELPGARAGLVGMSERAGLLGGSFEAGPRDGYWSVRAALPRDRESEGRA